MPSAVHLTGEPGHQAMSMPVCIETMPVNGLIRSPKGEETVPPPLTGRFVAVCMAVALLLTATLLRYFYVTAQWRAQVAAHAQAQVQALQARIRPHFLFNSMNSIASLIRHDPATAERAVEDLSELFRAALGTGSGLLRG